MYKAETSRPRARRVRSLQTTMRIMIALTVVATTFMIVRPGGRAGATTNLLVESVSAGTTHSCAINLGLLYCWGDNQSGQLGDGTNVAVLSAKPVDLGLGVLALDVATGGTDPLHSHTCAVTLIGVKCWGNNDSGQLGTGATTASSTPVLVDLGVGVTASKITAGGSGTCASTANTRS